jgi:hypothetical protein
MPIDAEIEAAVAAMRSVRTKGAKAHEEVLRAYARAALQAAENARLEDFQRRARLDNKPKAPEAAETELTECLGNPPTVDG